MLNDSSISPCMSPVRISVEWPFGEITTYSAFNYFKENLKIGLQSVAKIYAVSCFICNDKACLHGSITASFFGLEPPSLAEYYSQSL